MAELPPQRVTIVNGLIVIATTGTGAAVGLAVGWVASWFFADMELGSLDVLAWAAGGLVVGGAAGAFVGGQLVG